MSTAFARPAPGRGAALLVLALHGLLLLAALRLGVWRDRRPPPPTPPPLSVRLLPWLQPAPPQSTPALPARRPTRERAAAPQRDAPPAEPQAITLPAPTAPAAPAVAAEVPASAPPALDLRLPRGPAAAWRARPPALDDARANTPRDTSIEARIANAIGGVGAQVVEERLDDGRMRLRRGTSCVIVHPNRASRIDPFNDSVSPKLRGVEKC